MLPNATPTVKARIEKHVKETVGEGKKRGRKKVG